MSTSSDVSICAPYWASDGNYLDVFALVRSARDHCPGAEISLCDDGSKFGLIIPGVVMTRLPAKDHALNPCVPINAAVAASTRPIIALTNPGCEIPIGALDRLLSRLTENGYVAAACSDGERWLCHSTFKASERLPPGSGFHFFAVLRRTLWDRAGGFDEAYRQGQAFDDADFLWRLHRAGAQCQIADDVVVSHRRSTTAWPEGGWELNRAIYRERRRAELER